MERGRLAIGDLLDAFNPVTWVPTNQQRAERAVLQSQAHSR